MDDPEGGWVDTHHYDSSTGGAEEKISEMTLEEAQPSIKADPVGDLEDDEDDEEAADMEAFEVSGMLDEQDIVSFFHYISTKFQSIQQYFY